MRVFLSKLAGVTGYAIQYYCIAHCTFEYLGDLVMCSGPSMEPTIYSDNILFTEHLTPLFRRLERGDIVIAKCPTNPKQQVCKRVKGLPGDRIRVGYASVEIVPRGHVWLEGDNTRNSSDSRNYGPVPQGLIRSRAVCRVWPFNEISTLKDE
ncbi:mitochondrial inner membrane protease subunit 1 [Atheta coriaria]|uniref:mitochondrial inner membrane protease subunit 1 n=1 Tax=Dalotia coriaria TaxID=877792 RepID=UPI0031F33AB6